jgi:hypothetical protein
MHEVWVAFGVLVALDAWYVTSGRGAQIVALPCFVVLTALARALTASDLACVAAAALAASTAVVLAIVLVALRVRSDLPLPSAACTRRAQRVVASHVTLLALAGVRACLS